MKFLKKVLAGVAVAAAMASAQASPVTVGGITWDPDYFVNEDVQDFTMEFSFTQFFTFNQEAGTAELKGFGEAFAMNGVSADQYSTTGGNAFSFAPGRELTFSLSGLLVTGTGQNTFSGGKLNLYSDNHNNFNNNTNGATGAGATDTDLSDAWLMLEAVSSQFVSTSADINNPLQSGQLTVQWSVVGGLAADNFDTDFYTTYDARTRASAEFSRGIARGNGTFTSNTIPEPESLALVGLGLLGLAAARRRKQA